MPRTLLNPVVTGDLIRTLADKHPERVGLIFEGEEYTYAQMNERANRAAQAFIDLGLKPGDRVAWLARNVATFWEALLGAAKIGVVMTPINWRLSPDEVVQILTDSKAKLFVGEKMFVDPLEAIDGYAPPPTLYLETGGDACFNKHIDNASAAEPTYEASGDDVLVQLYTSGTTGLPKGVLLTNRCYYEVGVAGEQQSIVIPLSDDESILHVLPHFHVAGVNLV